MTVWPRSAKPAASRPVPAPMIDDAARRRREEMHHVPMHVGEGDALALLDALGRRLAVALGAARSDGHAGSVRLHGLSRPERSEGPHADCNWNEILRFAQDDRVARACFAASKAARRSVNLPAAGPSAAAIVGAGIVS